MRSGRRNGGKNGERGAALAEFTFVGPVMLLILAAVCDIGTVLRESQSVTYALREAARIASTSSLDVPNQSCAYYENTAKVAAKDLLQKESGLDKDWNVNATVSPAETNPLIGGAKYVSVRVIAKRNPVSFLPGIFPGVSNIQLSHSFRVYRECA